MLARCSIYRSECDDICIVCMFKKKQWDDENGCGKWIGHQNFKVCQVDKVIAALYNHKIAIFFSQIFVWNACERQMNQREKC